MKPTVALGDLSGPEGNVYVILGRCQAALREAGGDVYAFMEEATAGNYEHALRTVDEWFTVVEVKEHLVPTTAIDMLERSRQ